MPIKTKILIGVFFILIISAGGWWVWNEKTGKPEKEQSIKIKGKLEIAEGVSPLFNKECLNNDFRVGSYYLKGNRNFYSYLLQIKI